MRIISATLSINEAADPPTAALSVEVEGHPPVLTSEDVPPADVVAVLRAVGDIVDVDLVNLVRGELDAIVDTIEQQVTTGRARQSAREFALTSWQQATT